MRNRRTVRQVLRSRSEPGATRGPSPAQRTEGGEVDIRAPQRPRPGAGGRGTPASVSPGGTLRSHESAWAGDTEGAQWLRVHRTLRTASPETESGCVLPGPEAGLGSGRDGDGVSVWGEGKVWN